MLRNESPTIVTASYLETVSLEGFHMLENKLKDSQNAFENLQKKMYEKENQLDDLSFLLEEAKSKINDNQEAKPNLQEREILPIIEVKILDSI